MSAWEWVLHGWIAIGLLTVAGNLTLNLLVFRRPLRTDRLPPGAGRVSVLVPARNEERRIGACLESLLVQAGEAVEILLLDDHSTDRTAEIARSLGFSEDGTRLRLLTGRPLPDGWTGKGWACHQLAQAARGDWLLFTDADTVHEPDSVASIVTHARRWRYGMLSLWPRQLMGSWSERLVIPLIGLLILGFLPQWMLVVLQRFPAVARRLGPLAGSLGAANGQCILFDAATYRAVGGHEAVRDHLVEDVALARRVAARTGDGLRLGNGDGCRLIRCRMYEDFRGVWEGFTKNLRPAFDGSPTLFILSLAVQFGWLILPFFLLVLAPEPIVLAECAAVIFIRLGLDLRTGAPAWLAPLHPVAHLLALTIAANSWRRCAGDGVTWKGRTYWPGLS